MTQNRTVKPPLLPEAAALLARLVEEDGHLADPTLMEPGAGRAQTARLAARWNQDLPAMVRDETVFVEADEALGSARCRLRVFVPESVAGGAIVFIHGGGFVFGSPESHERLARLLAMESGLPVLSVDYRLAPEHPYPAGLLDVVAVMRKALSITSGLGLGEGPLLLAGDSAGANLALAAMLQADTDGFPRVAGGLLFYGAFGAEFDTPSYRLFADGPGLTRDRMMRFWDWYIGRTHPADVSVFPLMASDEALRALPPLYLMAAQIDPLFCDSEALALRLKALGRAESLDVVLGVPHGFLQHTLYVEAAREAVRRAGKAARAMATNSLRHPNP